MRTPDDIYEDFASRREGVLTALVHDTEAFFKACDPARENLCLYGNVDGSYSVVPPAEEVPPELPEPALGINFARDGMARKDWLCLVAVHSDCWLLSVVFYNGARLPREGRERLFQLVNELPTVYEIVSGRAPARRNGYAAAALAPPLPALPAAPGRPKKRGAPGAPLQPLPPQQQPQQQQQPPAKRQRVAAAARRRYKDEDVSDEDEEEEEGDTGDGYADGEGEPCPNCGRIYRAGEFWIACDFCDTWYDGKCVQMTALKAERMGKWRCPACERRL